MWLKYGAIPPHRKHLENSMTELSGSIAGIVLLTLLIIVCFDDVTPASQFTSIVELK